MFRSSIFYFLLLTVIVFFGYYNTLAPSLVELDSGELATAQATLGIAHPTGYPLFTLLGYLFIQLPLPFTPVFKSNILGLLWTLGSVIMFTLMLKTLYENFPVFQNEKDDRKLLPNDKGVLLPVIFISGLIYAFSRTVWIQSTSVEVYSLHLLLVTCILYFFIKAVTENSREGFRINSSWMFFAFFLGLGFTNHLSTLYLIPGIVVFFIMHYKFSLKILSKLLILFPIFITPIFILNYLLMLRSAQEPLLNWGNPSNFGNLIYHITGLQFKALGFAQENSPTDKLLYFFQTLIINPFSEVVSGGEFGIFILLVIAGFYYFYKSSKKITLLLTIFFFTSLLSINYRINDIDAYFLLSYIAAAIFISGGLFYLYTVLKKFPKYIIAAASIVCAIIILQYLYNSYQVDQSDVYIYEDFTKAVFNDIDSNAVLFCSDQDPFIATSYYSQVVEGLREDVTKVVTPFLFESWYADWVDQISPGLTKRRGKEISINLMNRPVYISLGLLANDKLIKWMGVSKAHLIPDGMFFRYIPDSALVSKQYVQTHFKPFPLRLTGRRTGYTQDIETYIETMLNARVYYELKFKQDDKAYSLLNDAINMKIKLNPSLWSFLFVQPVNL